MNRVCCVLCVYVLSMFLFASCKTETEYEPSTVPEDEISDEYFQIDVVDVDAQSGLFVFTNCSDKRVSYGDRNLLEKNIDGKWMSVISYNQRELAEPSYELLPHESIEYKTEWGPLEEGDYRYIIPLTPLSDEHTLGLSLYAAASFTI